LLNSTIRASSAVSELVVTIVVCFSTSTSTSQRVLVHSCSRAESSGARRFPSLADSAPIVVRWPRLSPAGPNGLCGVSLFSSFALLFLSHLASSSPLPVGGESISRLGGNSLVASAPSRRR
jgi:hypothetical protein